MCVYNSGMGKHDFRMVTMNKLRQRRTKAQKRNEKPERSGTFDDVLYEHDNFLFASWVWFKSSHYNGLLAVVRDQCFLTEHCLIVQKENVTCINLLSAMAQRGIYLNVHKEDTNRSRGGRNYDKSSHIITLTTFFAYPRSDIRMSTYERADSLPVSSS
jgi:hypothetical protein